MSPRWHWPSWLRRKSCPGCGHMSRLTFCQVCGYCLVRRDRDRTTPKPPA